MLSTAPKERPGRCLALLVGVFGDQGNERRALVVLGENLVGEMDSVQNLYVDAMF
jgi:hypothetical protein